MWEKMSFMYDERRKNENRNNENMDKNDIIILENPKAIYYTKKYKCLEYFT